MEWVAMRYNMRKGRREVMANEHKNKQNRNVEAHFETGSNTYFHYVI